MTTLIDLLKTINPADVRCYCDTIGLFFRRGVHVQELGLVAKLQGGAEKVLWQDCRDDKKILRGHRLIVHQPTKETLLLLDDIQHKYDAAMCRVDIALDLMTAFSAELKQLLATQLVMNYRPKGPMYDFLDTTYLVSFAWRKQRGKRPACRAVAIYADKENRFTGETDCVHWEIRFLGSSVVRPAGFRKPSDMLRINPMLVFDKHMKLSTFDVKKFKRKRVKDIVAQLAQTEPYGSYVGDVTWANSWFNRVTENRVQLIKDVFDVKVLAVDLSLLHIPDRLMFDDNYKRCMPFEKYINDFNDPFSPIEDTVIARIQ